MPSTRATKRTEVALSPAPLDFGQEQLELLRRIASSLDELKANGGVARTDKGGEAGDLLDRLSPTAARRQSSSSPPLAGRRECKDVHCRYNFFNIEEVDVMKKCITAKVYFEATWHMPELKETDPETQDERILEAHEIEWTDKKVWKPDMVFANKVGELTTEWVRYDVDKKYCDQFKLPMASWRTVVTGSFSVTLDLARFPYDEHEFMIKMTTNHTTDECRLVPNEFGPSMAQIKAFTIKESWEVTFNAQEHVKALEHRKGRAGHYAEIHGGVPAKRNPQYYLANVVLMMFIIVCLSFTIFGLPVRDLGDRLNIVMTLVLTAVAFKLLLAEQLPDIPYLTYLDFYLLGGIFLLTLMAAECFLLEQIVPETQQEELDFLIGIVTAVSWLLLNVPLLSPLLKEVYPHLSKRVAGYCAAPLMAIALMIWKPPHELGCREYTRQIFFAQIENETTRVP